MQEMKIEIEEQYIRKTKQRAADAKYNIIREIIYSTLIDNPKDSDQKTYLRREIREAVRKTIEKFCNEILDNILEQELKIEDFEDYLDRYNILIDLSNKNTDLERKEELSRMLSSKATGILDERKDSTNV